MKIQHWILTILVLFLGTKIVYSVAPPTLPEEGAYHTDTYRNLLKEAGYSDTAINNKLNTLWTQFFYGNSSTQALFYPVGSDEAYILDTGNNDVRSEGMSYGMMICVQMDKQTEFNRLWKWAKTRMQHTSGEFEGYFAWQMNTNGSVRDRTPASDGEEYFITALMFASNRWGDGEGIYNYKKEANDLLAHCMRRGDSGGGVVNLFNSTQKQVVFCPYGSSASFTDPSYHLPAFYELWGKWDSNKSRRQFWKDCAGKSRNMFQLFAHSQTGLMPDYANFDGSPRNDGNHAHFYYDAWRCIFNMAVDYAWFKADEREVALVNKIHNFFYSKGVTSYSSIYTLDGTVLYGNTDHSPGLVACNAGGTLASNQAIAWDFITNFFNTAIPIGQYRYYDGMLYFLNYLLLSGNYKIYKPENNDDDDDGGDDNGPNQVSGYFTIEDFNWRELGETHTMYKQNPGNGIATVTLSPTDPTEQVAQVITDNWDEFILFEATLPQEKSWSDYESLCFDVYFNSAASGSDHQYKNFFVHLDNKQIHSEATGATTGANHNVWLYRTIPLQNISASNSFKLRMGIRSNKANYYVDNVRLKEIPHIPTSILDKKDSHYTRNGNIISTTEMAENMAVYNLSGQLLLSQRHSSSIDISSLDVGVYLVVVLLNRDRVVGRVVR